MRRLASGSALAVTCAIIISLFGAGLVGAADHPAPFAGHWIDVDLTSRVATAFDGGNPVYSAPITSGKPGWRTSTGTFYIWSRVDNETMDSETIGVPHWAAEGYLIKNVRYTQYIAGDGTALHANYWANDWVFGHADVSHGCVSMRTVDAAYFWGFATYGTPVVIHRGGSVAVESVVGKQAADARARLEAAGLKVEVTEQLSDSAPAGTVIAQSPAGGTSAALGTAVKLTVSLGQPTPTPVPTPVPAPVYRPVRPPEGNAAWVADVVGLPEAEARTRLDQAGLSITYTNYQSEADVPEAVRPYFRSIAPGAVLSTTPGVDTQLSRGAVIQIAVRRP